MAVATDTHRAIEAVWRIESPRLIAGLTRLIRDVGTAEELAQDALVAALEQWPSEGVPKNPGAWLMTTAKRRAIDQIRRNETFKRKSRRSAAILRSRRRTSARWSRRTTASATTCCGWCSSPATRCCPRRPGPR
ncbi:hypothetical protein GCM10018954_054560 [Kutzneria kofuensis]